MENKYILYLVWFEFKFCFVNVVYFLWMFVDGNFREYIFVVFIELKSEKYC